MCAMSHRDHATVDGARLALCAAIAMLPAVLVLTYVMVRTKPGAPPKAA
jgi:hypothetical protein